MKRKLLSVLLTFCLAFSLLPTAALADGETAVAKVGVTEYATLAEAVEKADSGATVTLLKDTAVSAMIMLKKSLTLNLNGHKLNNEGNINSWVQVIDNAKLTINGTVEGSAAYGRMNLGIATNNNGSLEINGGIYAVGDDQTVLHINGTCMSSDVTINGATINATNDNGIQLNGKGTFSITNSMITGGTGIYIKAGTLTLENTKVTGTLSPVNYSYNGNGANATGDAVVIDACNYPGGNPTIAIKSGEFTGSKAAIGYYQHPGSESTAAPGTAAISITGGTFNTDVSAYVADGYILNNGTVEKLGETNAVAQIGDTYYKTLADAVAAAKADEATTITLLKDVELPSYIYIKDKKNITLDLNGKNITRTGNGVFYVGNAKLRVTGTGTIFENQRDGFAPIIAKGSPNDVADYTTITIDENVTLKGDYAGIFVDTDTAGTNSYHNYGLVINMKGSIDLTAIDGGVSAYGVYVQGLNKITSGNVMQINLDGVTINTGDEAIYAAGYAKWNVKNCTFNAENAAIEVRAGDMTIDGGVYTAMASEFKCEANGNGSTTQGAALAIMQHTTKLPISVYVKNGVFHSAAAVAEKNIQKNNPKPNVDLQIADGQFNGVVVADDVLNFISGGYFTSDPSSYKAADRYVVASDVDGYTYMVTATAPTDDQKITVVDKTNASVDPSITGNDKTAIESAMSSGKTNVDGVAEAVSTTVKTGIVNDAKNKANNVPTGEVTSTEIEVKVNVSVTEANLSEGSMTFKAEPVANVKVNGIKLQDSENKPVEVPVSNAMLNGKPITVKLPLPTVDGKLFTPKQIKHTSSDGSVEYFLDTQKTGAKTFEIKDGCAVFTITKFSTFELSGTVTYVEPSYSSGSSSDPTYSVSTPSKTKNGSVTVSPKSASKGDTVTVTVKPDSGYVLETLTVTDKNGNELTLKDKGNGKYTFTMPAGKVEVKATFMEDNSMLNFFYDVPNNAYFYEAVKWAVKNGITTGVGNNLFAPEQPCTRAQIVTFLWRAAGSPEPKGAASGMTDVVSGSYYEKAVAWAIENGITTGTTTTTFSPDATCTRAQAVTFLARALKAKAASAAEFSDVPTGSYFADAVAWAAANGVTEGIGGGLFGSDNDCTRGQIVTFLYRAYNK